MARMMLQMQEPKQKQQTRQSNEQLLMQTPRQKTAMSQMQIERILNRKRSKDYIDAMKRLDAGGHMHNQRQVEALQELIRAELPEIEIDMGPIGIVSRCYLGAPYEVHTLDLTGAIIEHYETYRSMPATLEKARNLALCGHYEFIEVYHHALRAVKADGTVSTLKE